MLGVLKRRWKPKRASNANRLSVDSCPVEFPSDKPRVPSVRQIHPLLDDRHMYGYDKRASLDSNQPSYPLAPNICVEGGRIEFIKLSPDGGSVDGEKCDKDVKETGVNCDMEGCPKGKVTVTRGQQTEEFEDAKDMLEARILELEETLEQAKRTELRDKQTLAKLQKQLQRRESAVRDVDRERRLRAESEAKVREAAAEAARCRNRLKILTSEFSRMEETVRAMLVYKSRAEQLKQEKSALAIAYESRSQHYQSTISRLNAEVVSLRQQLESASAGPAEGRLAALEADNAVLSRDAEATRRQYERCLDDVANQVVRALLAQKNLREEISSLTRRIKDLESQNKALTNLLVHQLRGDSEPELTSTPLALEDSPQEPQMCDNPITSNLKHCNSFNSEHLNEVSPQVKEKRLSFSEVLDTRLSFEDKKRHQVLTKLWSDLKGNEVTPQRLIEALSNVDPSLWVSPQRPVSLNLQLPIFQNVKCRRTRPILAQSSSKSEEETGNESPESGNRDEGYSTMSSDVQGEIARASGEPSRGLEDLKEATDETDHPDTRIIVLEDQGDPDILYIPLNFALGLNPRNSFPPSKGILPFQHIMRSFSDSHLCLKITTAPSPCYSLSPISSSPSILVLDISERIINPLRRTKATSYLPVEYNEESQSRISWCSNPEDFPENWEHEYVQQWLKIDDKTPKDLLELEYDRAELEDWSLNLSNEDINWRKSNEILTPGQISLSTLPSIQENNALELEEDSNEDLWNNSSYMMDKTGGELIALLMDAPIPNQIEKRWPYAINGNITSPGDSWSSAETNSDFYDQETYSKRSSAALSGCSDDTNEMHAIGTDFTRDFYRLVKFESTKSLASISSKSAALSDCERDHALQNVLTFIAEQQLYCQNEIDHQSTEQTKEFNIEAPPQNIEEISEFTENENYINQTNNNESYIEEKQGLDSHSNPANITDSLQDISVSSNTMTESQTSSISTPDTIVSRIPRRQISRTSTPLKSSPKTSPLHSKKIPVPQKPTKIPNRTKKISKLTNSEEAKNTESPKSGSSKESSPQRLLSSQNENDIKVDISEISLCERLTSEVSLEEACERSQENIKCKISPCERLQCAQEDCERLSSVQEAAPTKVPVSERLTETASNTQFEKRQISSKNENLEATPTQISSCDRLEPDSLDQEVQKSCERLRGTPEGSPSRKLSDRISKQENEVIEDKTFCDRQNGDRFSQRLPKYKGIPTKKKTFNDRENPSTSCDKQNKKDEHLLNGGPCERLQDKKENERRSSLSERLETMKEGAIVPCERLQNKKDSESLSAPCERLQNKKDSERLVQNSPPCERLIKKGSSPRERLNKENPCERLPNKKDFERPSTPCERLQKLELSGRLVNSKKMLNRSISENYERVQKVERLQKNNSSDRIYPSSSSKANTSSEQVSSTFETTLLEDPSESVTMESYKRLNKTVSDPSKMTRLSYPNPTTPYHSVPIISSEYLPKCDSGLLSNIIDGPPHRAVSFHERATSKDVIDELNRIIRKGEETGSQEENLDGKRLDEACRPTGWVHVEKMVDINDPKVRANLLDVMLASSDSSPTSSCGDSISSDSTEEPPDYGHLHRIHRFNRQRKASAVRPRDAVVRCAPSNRPCIIGRDDLFVRYGDKEREAVASFDFLDGLNSSIEEEDSKL